MQSDTADHCHTELRRLIYLIMLQDCAVEPDISPFFLTIGAFKSLHVSVQHNASMHAFEAAVHIGKCWETFNYVYVHFLLAMLSAKLFFASDRCCNSRQ